MHEGGSSSGCLIPPITYITPDTQPRVRRMEFEQRYRELVYLPTCMARLCVECRLEV
jgi:hypothetical protein